MTPDAPARHLLGVRAAWRCVGVRLVAVLVARLFVHGPGVIILERPERLHKRRYRSIRIPRAVYERVILN
jgi:hypothetical protein